MAEKPLSKKQSSQKRRDADPKRRNASIARSALWQKNNPEACAERMEKIRREKGRNDGIYAQMIEQSFQPITVSTNNALCTSDFHIPFHSPDLVDLLIAVAEEYGVRILFVAGDFWDCDNYSVFTKLGPALTFKEEVNNVKEVLKRLIEVFPEIYFCRGNHERRWINLNGGMMDLEDLFSLTKVGGGYTVTNDDHMWMIQNDERWLLCHPRNFRITPLSVVRDLSAKHQCNVIGGHGHQFGQGWDRSGQFRIADGGGLFDKQSLEYLRSTSCHPETKGGFYLVQDNNLLPFEINPLWDKSS